MTSPVWQQLSLQCGFMKGFFLFVCFNFAFHALCFNFAFHAPF